jgi:hypothetical protein
MVIPVRDDAGNISGSLEIYTNSDASQIYKQDGRLKQNDQYWLTVFEGYAASIGAGMKQFMRTLLSKLAIQVDLIRNELNFEINTFVPV